MSENTNDINLELTSPEPAAAAAPADFMADLQAAPSAPITLSLGGMQAEEAPAEPEEKIEERTYDDSMLSEEEKKMVAEFAKQIDVMNTAQVLQYGAGAQSKVAGFSEKALDNVKTKDLGEVGGLISSAVTELKGFDAEEEQKGFFGRVGAAVFSEGDTADCTFDNLVIRKVSFDQ